MNLSFPIEFIVEGTPVSRGSKLPKSRNRWKARVREASKLCLPEGYWAATGRVAVTLFYFPAVDASGDVDNISKLVLDALCQHIYMDDNQVERIVVQKFEPGRVFAFESPSETLTKALNLRKPLLYVRITDDPFEELK